MEKAKYYNETKKKARYKYEQKNLKRVPLDVQKEEFEKIKAAAIAAGETVNGYIKKSIRARMDRDGFDPSDCPGDAAPPPEEVQEKK